MESIREHGVLYPVIVWQEGDGYEMLAEHNRQMAGKLSGLAEKGKIRLDAKTAKCVRGMAGSVTEKRVLETLDGGRGKKDSAGKPIKLSADVYERYFASVKPADVAGIVEEALAAWFGKGEDADVPDGRDREAG